MIIAAALCPATPLLLPGLSGVEPVLPELRQHCLDAIGDLLDGSPEVVAVVGAAAKTGTWNPEARLDPAVFAPGIDEDYRPGDAGASDVPAALGIGAALLDLVGYGGNRILRAVGADERADACGRIGTEIAGWAGRTALLVVADGSARRGPKAPGYVDERSAEFDAVVEDAIGSGDLQALLEVDPELANDLMATGRPAWQVLAGALYEHPVSTQVRYSGDPFGVSYVVASIRPQDGECEKPSE